jgi:hypothetical protein
VIDGACHCGAVRWRLKAAPAHLTRCTCSYCRRAGALWGAVLDDGYTLDTDPGDLQEYAHGDRSLAFVRCRRCGVLSHWRSLTDTRVRMNWRLVDPVTRGGLGVRTFDGADTWRYLD